MWAFSGSSHTHESSDTDGNISGPLDSQAGNDESAFVPGPSDNHAAVPIDASDANQWERASVPSRARLPADAVLRLASGIGSTLSEEEASRLLPLQHRWSSFNVPLFAAAAGAHAPHPILDWLCNVMPLQTA